MTRDKLLIQSRSTARPNIMSLIGHIANKDYTAANAILEERITIALAKRLLEMKKAIAAEIIEEEVEEEVQLDEARIKIIKARIRNGKVQRRKKLSNVKGYRMTAKGTLKRMTPAERRRRKLGQKRGKIKRRAKMSRTRMRRKVALRKRKMLGLS
jgi:hypothetical protein